MRLMDFLWIQFHELKKMQTNADFTFGAEDPTPFRRSKRSPLPSVLELAVGMIILFATLSMGLSRQAGASEKKEIY